MRTSQGRQAATTAALTPETAAAWTTGLSKLLRGLNPFDAEDRSTYRGRVQTATEHTTATRIREVAAYFGRPVAGNSTRFDAQRAVAEAWIARAQQDAVARIRLTPTQHATLAWYASRQADVRGGRVIRQRGTPTFGSLFAVADDVGFLEWAEPAGQAATDSRKVRVTPQGLAWLDAAGTTAARQEG